MIIFLSFSDSVIEVQARPESEDGQEIGDMLTEVRPGQSFYDIGYKTLRAMGEGEHEVQPVV